MLFSRGSMCFSGILMYLLILNPVFSVDTTYINESAGSVVMTVNQTWTIDFNESCENLSSVILFIYPPQNISPYQHVISYSANHEYKIQQDDFSNDVFVFNITNNITDELNITISTKLRVDYSDFILDHEQRYVKSKYPFKSNLTAYNEPIRQMAVNLTKDKHTLTEKIIALTNWVYSHVEYDGFYKGTNDDAINVYKRRKGTCDEYSVLLASLARSIGIPMRIVYGYVYSEDYGWQRHAWTEYFDGKDWYPIDPTFLQMINLDPYHIELAHAPDPTYLSEKITLIGYELPKYKTKSYYNVHVNSVKSCNQTVKIKPVVRYLNDTIHIDVVIEGGDHYTTETYIINYAKGLTMLTGRRAFIKYLKPHEKYIMEIDFTKPEIKPGYIYSFPYSISTRCGSYNSQFSIDEGQSSNLEPQGFDRFRSRLSNTDFRIYLVIGIFIILILTSIHIGRKRK